MLQLTEDQIRKGADVIQRMIFGEGKEMLKEVVDATKLFVMQEKQEPLINVMLRKGSLDQQRFNSLKERAITKFNAMDTAIKTFKNQTGKAFRPNGRRNHAFMMFPTDSYSYNTNAITTDSDFIFTHENELYECDKEIAEESVTKRKIRRHCSPVEFGQRTFGQLASMEKLNLELDLVKNEIYAVDLKIPAILDIAQPEKGSYVDLIYSAMHKIVSSAASSFL